MTEADYLALESRTTVLACLPRTICYLSTRSSQTFPAAAGISTPASCLNPYLRIIYSFGAQRAL